MVSSLLLGYVLCIASFNDLYGARVVRQPEGREHCCTIATEARYLDGGNMNDFTLLCNHVFPVHLLLLVDVEPKRAVISLGSATSRPAGLFNLRAAILHSASGMGGCSVVNFVLLTTMPSASYRLPVDTAQRRS